MTTTAPAPYTHTLRVYWEDTDAGGVVFYANYLKFFERARTEWLRAMGFGQQQLMADEDAMFIVCDTALRYLRPARLDDELQVTARLAETGRVRLTLAQQALCRGELLAEGTIRIACVQASSIAAGTFLPRRIPTALLDRIGDYG